jgi:hypothetical protein
MTRLADPSRELLFGLLALQNGLIEQTQLSAALNKWELEPGKSVVETLLEEGSIVRDQIRVIDTLAELHIKKSGDLPISLAATAQRVESPLRLDDPLRSEIAQFAPSRSQATQLQPGLEGTMPAAAGEGSECCTATCSRRTSSSAITVRP